MPDVGAGIAESGRPVETGPEGVDVTWEGHAVSVLIFSVVIVKDNFTPDPTGAGEGKIPPPQAKAGAGDEARTRDVLLGKEVLYH
jgi:hypothetical protein